MTTFFCREVQNFLSVLHVEGSGGGGEGGGCIQNCFAVVGSKFDGTDHDSSFEIPNGQHFPEHLVLYA
jgi:hypothetical protein